MSVVLGVVVIVEVCVEVGVQVVFQHIFFVVQCLVSVVQFRTCQSGLVCVCLLCQDITVMSHPPRLVVGDDNITMMLLLGLLFVVQLVPVSKSLDDNLQLHNVKQKLNDT